MDKQQQKSVEKLTEKIRLMILLFSFAAVLVPCIAAVASSVLALGAAFNDVNALTRAQQIFTSIGFSLVLGLISVSMALLLLLFQRSRPS